MPNSMRPTLQKHGGKIAGGVAGAGGIITIVVLALLNMLQDGKSESRPDPENRRGRIEKIAAIEATNIRQDMQIQHNREAVTEIKSDSREIKKGNRAILQAVNDLKTEVGALKARIDIHR